jgi:hypothetical protein
MAATGTTGTECPTCGRNTVVPIIYGMPTPEGLEAAERGEFVLGGCCIFDGQATRRCTACDWDDSTGSDWLDGWDLT